MVSRDPALAKVVFQDPGVPPNMEAENVGASGLHSCVFLLLIQYQGIG